MMDVNKLIESILDSKLLIVITCFFALLVIKKPLLELLQRLKIINTPVGKIELSQSALAETSKTDPNLKKDDDYYTRITAIISTAENKNPNILYDAVQKYISEKLKKKIIDYVFTAPDLTKGPYRLDIYILVSSKIPVEERKYHLEAILKEVYGDKSLIVWFQTNLVAKNQ
jgi:hypothetical protein